MKLSCTIRGLLHLYTASGDLLYIIYIAFFSQ